MEEVTIRTNNGNKSLMFDMFSLATGLFFTEYVNVVLLGIL